MADRPLRPATRLCLGEPLPHQLADRPRGHPEAADHFLNRPCGPKRIFGINPGFPGLSPTTGQIPTRYSPVRRSTPPSKLGSFPLDLHVLSLPPAFNLSHDQTLQFKILLKIKTNFYTHLIKVEFVSSYLVLCFDVTNRLLIKREC